MKPVPSRSLRATALAFVLACTLAFGAAPAFAEDIDLFVDSPTNTTDLPNVLFIVDNTANWNTAFTNEMAALANTLRDLPTGRFNIGIMLSTETGQSNNNISGGYVRAAIRPMTPANKAAYQSLVLSFDKLADKGNGGASGVTMAEAYRYFSGGAPHAGNYKTKADFEGNSCIGCNLTATQIAVNNAIYALPGNALSSRTATSYTSPVKPGCAKNYIIYISNGPNQENSSADTLANNMLTAAGGSATQLPLSPSGSQSNPSDEWARFMHTSELGTVTYTIDVDPVTNGQGPGWTALLKSMAAVSNGKYTAVSSGEDAGAQISDAVNKALSEIQAVNGVFASVSLPVSVNTQGTYLNQVFVGMFRPDQDAYPRWNGNLKQYKLGFIGTELRLQDATEKSAINNLTGFITECARSYWTPTMVDSYWAFKPQGGCIPPAGSAKDLYLNSNFPDGNIVEKGAQGYVLRGATERNLKTCSPAFASCTTLTDFSTGNAAISQSLLGAADSAERNTLIDWARGLDVDNENANGATSDEMRPSAHGDVVHSRPVAINFGTDAAPKVVVFYGGNDGVFRAINGNRTAAIGSAPPGKELWSFMPPEFYGKIKRLRDNTVQVSYPNITTGSPQPKPYGVDGPITAYNDGSRAWIFGSMRRGGRALYAFDVNPSNPSNITLKWKRGCPNAADDTGCSAGFSDIGQTWSPPKALLAAGYGSSPLLVMGGGYDTCEDADPHTCSSPKGNGIYVMDANTGALLNTLPTLRSVVADVVVIPDSTTGLAKYAYAADLGGNVYRIVIGSAAPSAWTITRIASLGCSSGASCTANRKFIFAPDVVASASGGYVLLLGSGDREKPRLYSSPSVTNSVANYFFMLEDRPADSNWLSAEFGRCGSAVLCLDSLLGITTPDAPSPAMLATKKGWYLGLRSTEQVVTSAITVFGVVTFSTHQPDVPPPGSCSSTLGMARVYNVSYKDAASMNGTDDRFEPLPPIGLPPSPVAGMVTLDDGLTVPFCIGCSKDSPLEGKQPEMPASSIPNQPKSRVYWYIQR
jgi:type IV pilus assembly protein PilY1